MPDQRRTGSSPSRTSIWRAVYPPSADFGPGRPLAVARRDRGGSSKRSRVLAVVLGFAMVLCECWKSNESVDHYATGMAEQRMTGFGQPDSVDAAVMPI
jgi:hypothetical protein